MKAKMKAYALAASLVVVMLATPMAMYWCAAVLTPASTHVTIFIFALAIEAMALMLIRAVAASYLDEEPGEQQDLSEFYGPYDPTKETKEVLMLLAVIISMLVAAFASYIVYEGGSLLGAIAAAAVIFIAAPLLLLLLAEALAKALEEIRSASSG